ncbi:GNAT family N-acetyltransferase [Sphingomonas piscis]|uniref:GNAT family N-acetyltransferase n=1 Tax=Sphingomonas piscis TaxID=2714943 RepID=A0A6G7YP62_9SPHN|nr:GNAT family N-acetyltransferase [Sphingomonas piscis]QIK78530.1 GNAT family N-acetyltransferase [Sphingomonas piscis]
MRRELHGLIVRRASSADLTVWAALLAKLHPGQSAAEFEAELEQLTSLPEPYVGFLAFTDDGNAAGVIDARIRNYAEGSPDLKAAYVEDLWVEPEYRRSGVAAGLLSAVEGWAREQGMRWLGSDTEADRETSHAWHKAVGFEEVERLVVFGKALA